MFTKNYILDNRQCSQYALELEGVYLGSTMLTLHYIQNKNSSLYFVGIKLGINGIRKGGEFYLFKVSLCRYFLEAP